MSGPYPADTRPGARAILEKAVDILHEGGWQTNNYGPEDDPTQPHCVMGAAICARYDRTYTYDERRQATRAILKVVPLAPASELSRADVIDNEFTSAVYWWNDNVARDADDAIHLLKEALETLSDD